MSRIIKVGARIETIEELPMLRRQNLGNFVTGQIPPKKEDALKMARFCRRNKIYFRFDEVRDQGDYNKVGKSKVKLSGRLDYSQKDIREIIQAGGNYYVGRVILGESGGMLYWPKEYLIGAASGHYFALPKAKDMSEGKEVYLKVIKNGLALEKN